MQIKILGAESLGVRSLCCVVSTKDRKVVIDPGVALGFRRCGLLPYPVQVIASEETRKGIMQALDDATDVVISHYHGDHIPLVDANPYQLSLEQVAKRGRNYRLWAKDLQGLSSKQEYRASALAAYFSRESFNAEGTKDGELAFSRPVPHGKKQGKGGSVMMTRIEERGEVFVHASDIQMLDDEAIETIIDWQPSIVLASGPPVYLPGLTRDEREDALRRVLRLAERVGTVILDHHLMRSRQGEQWLDDVSARAGHKVICAADFMGVGRTLLEADRAFWYEQLPVPEGWHKSYALGETDVIAEWSERVAQVRRG